MPRCPCFPGSSRIPPLGRSLEPGTGISAPDCPNAILVRWSRTNQELCLDICSRDFNSTGRAPGRCFGAEEEERTFPGLGARQGNALQPGEALAMISRKLNKTPAAAPHRSVLLRQIPAGSSPGRAETGQGLGRDGGAEPGSPVLLQFGQQGTEPSTVGRCPSPAAPSQFILPGFMNFFFNCVLIIISFISACSWPWGATGTTLQRGQVPTSQDTILLLLLDLPQPLARPGLTEAATGLH